ncbi:MAG TPA: RdgB/HAM1 family non-canonical purine NTP pyrophosphatase [Candidatus Krumholzibacteria bacterium]|nr:RdgB/HAM1 family non-canonical purine NTP pyrophosphatase [Candidatus Krumholzibacteria bacterium]
MKLVLATHNRDKAREIVDILSGLDVDVVTLDDFPEFPGTVEDRDTLEANALKKAREARDHSGCSALADDTGLEVDALNGAPGVYSARYSGEGATYASNCAKLLREMEGVPAGQRRARFRTVMVLALTPADAARIGAADHLLTDGALAGAIATERHGDNGFGYDPVFIDAATGHTLAEMTLAEKNRTSHRYRALIEMRELMLRMGLARETR